jgi:hypothetical protein
MFFSPSFPLFEVSLFRLVNYVIPTWTLYFADVEGSFYKNVALTNRNPGKGVNIFPLVLVCCLYSAFSCMDFNIKTQSSPAHR